MLHYICLRHPAIVVATCCRFASSEFIIKQRGRVRSASDCEVSWLLSADKFKNLLSGWLTVHTGEVIVSWAIKCLRKYYIQFNIRAKDYLIVSQFPIDLLIETISLPPFSLTADVFPLLSANSPHVCEY